VPELGVVHQGFTGFLDLTAGMPDSVTGETPIDITDASEFLSLDLNPEAQFTVCIRPLFLPVLRAGVLDCDGRSDLGITASQDHNVGEVGLDGFTENDCALVGGTLESAESLHPNVCNGSLQISGSGEADSGAGALEIRFDEMRNLQGLPVELTVEAALPCGDEGEGTITVLGLVSALSRATILDVDNTPDANFTHELSGENFSCRNWIQENGPGRLVIALPTLHGLVGADMISVFVFDD